VAPSCGSNNNNNNVAGQMGRRCHGNVLPDSGRRRNCDFVYECLLELLAGETGNRNRCFWVYECLFELLADALEEDHHHCRCPR
jgi:hypothetical protein